ncbi:DUF1700 domain-containing protein [Cohnella sp. AR92]|uniref:DUF1700 domain-containing protein n=1 Tax=Cohnella sp. AR92 TaxID=648716 RepID=UPI000F8F33AE|nr:DUF1700 domain-containing protein [Cohnella sp. AR92]RUS49119.1 DUF1700 domain-containing protein [Cohnella sp. AR92]
MKKNEYLDALNEHLSVIPELERYDLIRELDYRIAYQLQKGRSEADILRELGEPHLRAQRILEERMYRVPSPPAAPASSAPRNSPDFLRMAGVGILLFFLNLVVLPILISLGAAILSIGASAFAAIASPLLNVLGGLWHDSFYPASLFGHVAIAGIGILLALLFIKLIKPCIRGIAAYARWNLRLLRGRE